MSDALRENDRQDAFLDEAGVIAAIAVGMFLVILDGYSEAA
jgi:hypothetical protein